MFAGGDLSEVGSEKNAMVESGGLLGGRLSAVSKLAAAFHCATVLSLRALLSGSRSAKFFLVFRMMFSVRRFLKGLAFVSFDGCDSRRWLGRDIFGPVPIPWKRARGVASCGTAPTFGVRCSSLLCKSGSTGFAAFLCAMTRPV